MVHGTPDWGGSAPKITTYKLDDHAELAARLGSIVSYDRRGEVLWLQDFTEGGQPFQVAGFGIGGDGYLTCAGALSGGICLCLQTDVLAGDYERVYQHGYYQVEGGVGQEIWFTVAANLRSVRMRVIMYTGVRSYDYQVMYNQITGELSVYEAGGAWPVIGVIAPLDTLYASYHPFKMVFNTITHEYVRVLLVDKEFSARGIGCFEAAIVSAKSMISMVYVTAEAAGGCAINLDNWIMTQNEPVT
jgi:hypothetical protein